MAELRRRFKPEVARLSEYPASATSLSSGAMTIRRLSWRACRRARRAHPRLLHRRPRQERHDGAVRDAAPPPADLHARRKEPWFFASDSTSSPLPADRAALPRDARAEYADAVRPAPRRAARRRGVTALPVVAHRGRRTSQRSARRAHHRDPARARELPALAASAAAAELYIETETRLRQGDSRSRHSAARGKHVPRHTHRPQLLLYSEHVRYVEQLRRYHAAFPPGADARADLRRLPRRQRGDSARRAALPRRGRRAAGRDGAGQPHGRSALTAHDEFVHAVGIGRGPVSRAVKAAIKALTPRARGAMRCTRSAPGRVRAAPGRRRGADARAARATSGSRSAR